jgi:hypothetical protein
MIPAHIDCLPLFDELNALGISDYKIEAMCGLSEGHVSHMRAGRWKAMNYENTARVYNLWFDEITRVRPENTQGMAATT